MVRTSLFLSRPLRARLRKTANALGVKQSEVIRHAVQHYFDRLDIRKRRDLFPIESMEHLVDSGLLGDISLSDLRARLRASRRIRSKPGRSR